MAGDQPQSRNWCFTINNPSIAEKEQPIPANKAKYLVWQLEIGGNLATPHLQCYAEFPSTRKLSAVKKYNARAHWETRRGTDVEARNYCMKEETRSEGPWEQGEFLQSTQGQRKDLMEIKKKVDEHAPLIELWETDFNTMVKFHHAIQIYRNLKLPKRDWVTEVIVFWGEPGTGKSKKAKEEAGPDAFWVDPPKEKNTFWWDDYEGQENVVLDDFYGWFPWSFTLRLLDAYPMKVPVKGDSIQFCAKKIWITSNKEPKDWYDPLRFPFEPLERRLSAVYKFSKVD